MGATRVFRRFSSASTEAAPAASSTTSSPSSAPRYEPPKRSTLDEIAPPTKNFWEAPTRPGDWKISQQYYFLGAAGAATLYATYHALTTTTSDSDNGNGRERVNSVGVGGAGRVGGGGGVGGIDSTPAKRRMISEQDHSPVKKQ